MGHAYIQGARITEAVKDYVSVRPPVLSSIEIDAVKRDLEALDALDAAVALLQRDRALAGQFRPILEGLKNVWKKWAAH